MKSPVIQLIDIVWTDACHVNFSWRKLNHALYKTLNLAIKSGFKFEKDDFDKIAEKYRPGHWMGDIDRVYSVAIEHNTNAAMAIEAYLGRKPFIFRDVAHPKWMRNNNMVARGRIGVSNEFIWEGERVRCTSFNDKEGYIVACTYHGNIPETVKKQYKITHKDLRTELSRLKRVDKIKKSANLRSTFWQWIAEIGTLTLPEDKHTEYHFYRLIEKIPIPKAR